jgi:hypothetical protein
MSTLSHLFISCVKIDLTSIIAVRALLLTLHDAVRHSRDREEFFFAFFILIKSPILQ